MNDNHHNQPKSVEERIERLEIQRIRLETRSSRPASAACCATIKMRT